MLIYCNERRLTIDVNTPIIRSINKIDEIYELPAFNTRNQIVIDEHGKRILNLDKSPAELNLNPESTIYIVNPLVEVPRRPEDFQKGQTIEGVM